MALHNNGYRDFSSGVRLFGATASNSAYPYALHRRFASTQRNLTAGEGISDSLAGVPGGYRGQYAWIQPRKPGALASRNEIEASASLSAAGAMGLNAVAALEGAAFFEAVGDLVLSAAATISGGASVSANVVAALAAAASLAGSGSFTAAVGALAWAVAEIQSHASATFVPYATGDLAASIDVSASAELTAASIADEILDQQMIETGLSVRETLRLCAAALAGKISGADGATITIRNAVADDADRIVATVDANGNRTAITYDLA